MKLLKILLGAALVAGQQDSWRPATGPYGGKSGINASVSDRQVNFSPVEIDQFQMTTLGPRVSAIFFLVY